MELGIMIDILEKSVEKNGEKPLTNKWLLNILKIVEKNVEREAFKYFKDRRKKNVEREGFLDGLPDISDTF